MRIGHDGDVPGARPEGNRWQRREAEVRMGWRGVDTQGRRAAAEGGCEPERPPREEEAAPAL